MAKDSNIVHQYFRKETGDRLVLIKVNPLLFTGMEITVPLTGELQLREFEFDETFEPALVADGFQPTGAMEFNLYFSGLTGGIAGN
jgi:hypothetical protein